MLILKYAVDIYMLLLCVFIPTYSFLNLPPYDYLPFNRGVNILNEIAASESKDGEYATLLVYKNIASGEVKTFKIDDTEWQDDTKWEYVDTKTETIKEGRKNEIESFSVMDEHKSDVSSEVLGSAGYTFIVVSQQIEDLTSDDFLKLNSVYNLNKEEETNLIILTASDIGKSKGVIGENNWDDINIYNVDLTNLKSFLRSKKGVVLLNNGEITGKWNFRSNMLVNIQSSNLVILENWESITLTRYFTLIIGLFFVLLYLLLLQKKNHNQHMKIIIVLFIISILQTNTSFAQYKKPISVRNSVKIDGINNVLLKMIDVEKNEINWANIFSTKNNVRIQYATKDSSNVIRVNHSSNFRYWRGSSIKLNIYKKYNNFSELLPTLYGKNQYPRYLFYGDSTLKFSSLGNANSSWLNNRNLAVMMTNVNDVVSVINNNEGKLHIILNAQNKFGVNSIVSLHSSDNGLNWTMPNIALKHNTKELKACCISSKNNRTYSIYMILTDNKNRPYYSHSGDGGKSWSYPKEVSSVLSGDSHKMIINKSNVMILYRSLPISGNRELRYKKNDIMLWHGSISDFVNNIKNGKLIKVRDNNMNNSINYLVKDLSFYNKNSCLVLLQKDQNNESVLQLHKILKNI